VAYDRDFQPEFIDDGINGFIVPFRDHQSMAERVGQIITDPALARRLSAAIRAEALVHVNPERVKAAEWDAFDKVLGSNRFPPDRPSGD
jgi:glycosyltransferase involved in cell wall biosynthesis